QIEKENAAKIVVTTRAELDQPAPNRGTLRSASLEIQRGSNMAMPALLSALSGAGYERVAQVTTRGQFAVRGGIVDIFSWHTALPLRIEFYGDEIESLREFDLDTQTSVRTRAQASVLLSAADDTSGRVRDHITQDALVIELEPASEGGAPATPTSPELAAPRHIQISASWN